MATKEIKVRRYNQVVGAVFVLLVTGACGIGAFANQKETETTEQAPRGRAAIIIDTAKALFSLPTTPMQWVFKAKDYIRYGWNYFSTPNIDFRSGSNTHAEDGTGEKVKDAVAKSFDESKATVENTAKSAAKLTEEALDKTVKTLKRTLTKKGDSGKDHEVEL